LQKIPRLELQGMTDKTLSELKFKDLYVRIDPAALLGEMSRFNPLPGEGYDGYANKAVPPDWDLDIDMLRTALRKDPRADFAVTHDKVRLRVSKYPTIGVEGPEEWAAMRRFPSSLPSLEKLGFQPDVFQAFQRVGKRTGLIVVGGATGAGKTTTVVALARHFMAQNGGLLYTVEDPVEYLMAGPFQDNPENAFVLQREVSSDEEWADAIKAALRSAPKYIFLGEVRTSAAARQLLRASNSGHLVLCTIHGGSLGQTLSALIQIAAADLGPLAQVLLADGLAMVIHQEIISGRPSVEIVETKPNDNACPVRQNIRSGKTEMLATAIQQQKSKRALATEEAARSSVSPGARRPVGAGPVRKQPEKKKGFLSGLVGS